MLATQVRIALAMRSCGLCPSHATTEEERRRRARRRRIEMNQKLLEYFHDGILI